MRTRINSRSGAAVGRIGSGAVVAVAALALAGTDSIACERTLVLDLSGLEPPGVIGEVIGISSVAGEIVGATLDVTFVSSDPSDWFLAFDFVLPTGLFGVSSVTEGWSGIGSFKASFKTDDLNGPVAPSAGGGFWTWFVGYVGGSEQELRGGGSVVVPVDGFFETLVLTLQLECIAADLNGDGVVNGADLGLLLNAWGPCAGCAADINHDGVVDGADLGALLQAWSASDRI